MEKGIILIGMPGAGKSTLGVLLAKALGLDFLDTDVAIQVQEGNTLQAIIASSGYLHLRAIEEQVLLQTDAANKVVATGGSAVYSNAGMAHLKRCGIAVYLEASLPLLETRLHNYQARGIARRENQTFAELFAERVALYQRYGDITVTCDGRTADTLVQDIVNRLPMLKATDAAHGASFQGNIKFRSPG